MGKKKCKCTAGSRIVSNVVQDIESNGGHCIDVCASPICGEPHMLGIMAPLIYDEIGINLCATFDTGVDIPTTYPTATNAKIKVIDATYTYGADNVEIDAIPGRVNCYRITLANITVQFALEIYDESCRLLTTVFPEAVYLPPATEETYDEDTNPSSVEFDIFAPYGLGYNAAEVPAPVINFIGSNEDNGMVRQGVNLFAMAKVLDLDTTDSTVTTGLTLVLQSLYYTGYKVRSEGKIDIPKGSLLPPADSDCMRFVAGDLLNLEIKPLDLGMPHFDECMKEDCTSSSSCADNCVHEFLGR